MDTKGRSQREYLKVSRHEPRVLRGGAFLYALRNVRCACRDLNNPVVRNWDFGGRVVVRPCR
jgi:hypothetical protein